MDFLSVKGLERLGRQTMLVRWPVLWGEPVLEAVAVGDGVDEEEFGAGFVAGFGAGVDEPWPVFGEGLFQRQGQFFGVLSPEDLQVDGLGEAAQIDADTAWVGMDAVEA